MQAARLRGERPHYIMFSEILPNVFPLVVVEFTVRLGYAIFAIATLTFIGFGVEPPSPDWAAQINRVLDADRPVLVDDAVPGARDREPRGRREPRRRRHARGVRAVSTGRGSARARRRRPRARLPRPRRRPPGSARSVVHDRARATRTGSSASRGAGSRPPRSGSSDTSLATAGSRAGRLRSPDGTSSRSAAGARDYHARTVSMVYQNPGAALNPSHAGRDAGRRGVHRARRLRRRGGRARAATRSRACRSPIRRACWAAIRTSSRVGCSSAS